MPKNPSTPFNRDVDSIGSYVYTQEDQYSARIANKRQSDEIVNVITEFIKPPLRIADIGCGDGVYTHELSQRLHPSLLVAFDTAEKAISQAKKRWKKDKIQFLVGDIYTINRKFRRNQFNVGVIRGVLHHVNNPERAIAAVSKVLDTVVVLEPNGFNPMLKLIERFSSYHVAHGEKSYFPPTLNSWFINNGYQVVSQKYSCLVPYFCPAPLARVLKAIEPFVESMPVFGKFLCGTNLILYEKKRI